jgi:hypothetical protein
VYSIWKGPPSAGTSRLSLANTISGCASGVTGSSLLHPAKSEEPKIPPPEDHQQPYESKIFHSIKGFSAGPTAVFIFGRNEAGLKKAILSGSFLCVKRNVFLSI